MTDVMQHSYVIFVEQTIIGEANFRQNAVTDIREQVEHHLLR